MTQEDNELLLKDLCARLPYKVKCHLKYGSKEVDVILKCIDNIEFEINYYFPIIDQTICKGWHDYARGTYGYNRYGKPKCKLSQFFANPGGRFDFGPYREVWFTPIQNLIKQYIESHNN